MTQESKGIQVRWRIHTPNLLSEILNSNDGMGIFTQPLAIFGQMLSEVGDIALRINDPELNAMMLRLTIYSIADPTSSDYDPETVRKYLAGVYGSGEISEVGHG